MEKGEFIEIITKNQNLLYKIINSYCSHPESRRDLEQEILLQIWKSLKRFDGSVKITTWIYKVALNTAISFYRKENKRIDKPLDLDHSVFILPDSEYDPRTDEEIRILYKVIDRLSRMDKALMLLYLDNYKQKDIAEIIGISESNVATKISRLKKFLKEQFRNH
ncbi:MAG: sigma-70 family RNA polymerase sigma factor [Bacteroidales bacterium]|nr:sigma-70 family RNA polymerase sigma factor [Bacteroidales bacterium]MCF8328523.1 sigma-70 family RNA polymerase sigma factor [Bacteroidales bacterium]